ncbi:MAG: hypothetical protein HY359_15465 [Candidatus Rokubacteria bacterium]|nr:hypothetical protein [Candidatus Rokubacteria bacterium]
MLRDRLLSRRWLVFPIVAWGVVLAAAPHAADAAPLPPAGENGAAGEPAELAVRAHELRAGGSGVELLAFAIIVALLVVLVLELSGRRVISRP